MRKIAENRVRRGPENEAIRRCGLGRSDRNARTRFDRVRRKYARSINLQGVRIMQLKKTRENSHGEVLYNSLSDVISKLFAELKEKERGSFLRSIYIAQIGYLFRKIYYFCEIRCISQSAKSVESKFCRH